MSVPKQRWSTETAWEERTQFEHYSAMMSHVRMRCAILLYNIHCSSRGLDLPTTLELGKAPYNQLYSTKSNTTENRT